MTTGGVTGADADSRFTGAVCCFHHAWTTGRQDQVDVRVMHQRVRQFYRRLIDPANQVLRRAGRDGSLQHDISRFVGGFFCTRVRRENDGVTRFQTDERFENGC